MLEEGQLATIALSQVQGISRSRLGASLKWWQEKEQQASITLAFWAWLATTQAISIDWQAVEQTALWCQREKSVLLGLWDPRYPAWLKHIANPPLLLYAQGDLSLLSGVLLAIVGSRKPTFAGEQLAFDFAKALSAAGMTIVSGLALGIDSAAHRGALSGKVGKTVAVLGSGLARIYPGQHRLLAEDIRTQGVLLSEYSPYSAPLPAHFPERNRIISGLSRGVLVVEASLKSGSLITAKLALEQNREVMALPGSLANPTSQGTHRLIQEGALLVTTPQEVLTIFGVEPLPLESQPSKAKSGLGRELQAILDCVGGEHASIEKITKLCQLPIEEVTSKLAQLEFLGEITAMQGGYLRTMAGDQQ